MEKYPSDGDKDAKRNQREEDEDRKPGLFSKPTSNQQQKSKYESLFGTSPNNTPGNPNGTGTNGNPSSNHREDGSRGAPLFGGTAPERTTNLFGDMPKTTNGATSLFNNYIPAGSGTQQIRNREGQAESDGVIFGGKQTSTHKPVYDYKRSFLEKKFPLFDPEKITRLLPHYEKIHYYDYRTPEEILNYELIDNEEVVSLLLEYIDLKPKPVETKDETKTDSENTYQRIPFGSGGGTSSQWGGTNSVSNQSRLGADINLPLRRGKKRSAFDSSSDEEDHHRVAPTSTFSQRTPAITNYAANNSANNTTGGTGLFNNYQYQDPKKWIRDRFEGILNEEELKLMEEYEYFFRDNKDSSPAEWLGLDYIYRYEKLKDIVYKLSGLDGHDDAIMESQREPAQESRGQKGRKQSEEMMEEAKPAPKPKITESKPSITIAPPPAQTTGLFSNQPANPISNNSFSLGQNSSTNTVFAKANFSGMYGTTEEFRKMFPFATEHQLKVLKLYDYKLTDYCTLEEWIEKIANEYFVTEELLSVLFELKESKEAQVRFERGDHKKQDPIIPSKDTTADGLGKRNPDTGMATSNDKEERNPLLPKSKFDHSDPEDLQKKKEPEREPPVTSKPQTSSVRQPPPMDDEFADNKPRAEDETNEMNLNAMLDRVEYVDDDSLSLSDDYNDASGKKKKNQKPGQAENKDKNQQSQPQPSQQTDPVPVPPQNPTEAPPAEDMNQATETHQSNPFIDDEFKQTKKSSTNPFDDDDQV